VRLAKVSAGQTARIQVPGVGEVTGKVRFVGPEIDRQTPSRTRPHLAWHRSAHPVRQHRHGLDRDGRSCNVAIPVSALIGRGEETVVQVVKDGRVETRPVRIGLLEGGAPRSARASPRAKPWWRAPAPFCATAIRSRHRGPRTSPARSGNPPMRLNISAWSIRKPIPPSSCSWCWSRWGS
jgi:hypothetical protein